MVVAMSRDGLIGREGRLPWRLPRDLKRFREITWGKPVIMGRKTHESLGRPLPGRANIVLTRQVGYEARGCLVARDAEQAEEMARATGADEAMVIGGGDVYRTFLPVCETIHLTLVEGSFDGDAYFPGPLLGTSDWRVIGREAWPADAANPHEATYLVLRRTPRTSSAPEPSPGA
jgi:dihydrofolate reductase